MTENVRFLVIDPATGRPPLLTTTDFNYGPYNGPAGSWRVSSIMLKEPVIDYNLLDYGGQYGEKPYVNTTDHIEINGNWYYPFPFAKADDALDGALPQIFFSRNPGASTTKYYMQAFRTPTQITSTRIPLPIPDSYGCHRLYLLPACLALIEATDHGNYADGVAYIEGTLKPLMWKVVNKGQQGQRHKVTMRPC